MKILIIGGNRFVGLRVSKALSSDPQHELHILNRTGQAPHAKNAVIHKGDRSVLEGSFLDRDWDAVLDFAAFTADHAREAVKFFKNVKRYVCISSFSIYNYGPNILESDFNAKEWAIRDTPNEEDKKNPYQFDKRQMEAVFEQSAHFPVVQVRFPFILGPDDYTHRLSFHYDRVKEGKPIYMPAPKAKVSFVQSEDAANFLLWSLKQNFTGPVNMASPGGMGLDEMIAIIEGATGKKALLAKAESDSNHSPYGVAADMVSSVEKIKALGYAPKSLKSWFPELIAGMGGPGTAGRLH